MAETTASDGDAVRPNRAAPPKRLPMTVLRSIASRFTWLGLNLVTGVIAARALHPQGRGELAAMIIWPALLGGMTTFGLPNSLIYHVRREPEHASALAGWALLLCLVTTPVGTVIGWYVLPLWLGQQPAHIVYAAQLCLLAAPTYSLAVLGRAAWEAKGRFNYSNLSLLLPPLLVIIGLTALSVNGTLTSVSAAAVYVLAGIPVTVWMLVSVARLYRPTLRGTSREWRRLLHYGGRSYGSGLAGTLSLYIDQALAVGLLSSASMGIYVVAINLSRVVAAVNQSVVMILFPRVVGLAPGDMAKAVARWARMGTVASASIGVMVVVAGPSLLVWLYGPPFAAANQVLPILVCYVIVAGLSLMLLQGFLAAGRPGVATGVQVTGLVVSALLLVTLVPWLGLVGAAFALLIASCVRLAITLVCYRSVLRVPTPRVWLDRRDMAELRRYPSALIQTVLRFRPAEEVK